MKTYVLFVAVLAATGCSKKENTNEGPAPGAKPTTDPGTPPGATTPGTTAATPGATPGGKLDCDKVLPQALRDKYFKDKKIENVPGVTDYHGQCKIGYVTVGVMCEASLKNAKQATLEALPKNFPAMKPIEGVPDSLAHETGAGYQFTAYDNDSDCKIDGVVEKGVDGPAFVKDWLAALPLK